MFTHLCICFVCLNFKQFPFFSFKVEVYFLSVSSTRCSKLRTYQSAKCEYDFSPLILLPIQVNNRANTLVVSVPGCHCGICTVRIETRDNTEVCCSPASRQCHWCLQSSALFAVSLYTVSALFVQ